VAGFTVTSYSAANGAPGSEIYLFRPAHLSAGKIVFGVCCRDVLSSYQLTVVPTVSPAGIEHVESGWRLRPWVDGIDRVLRGAVSRAFISVGRHSLAVRAIRG
jgi:hypothetical protein